jgi:hypothetical protein
MTDAKHLEAAIRELRAEIGTLAADDDEARARLDRLVQDIEATLADPKRTGARGRLTGQLQASLIGFEASHPRMAALMNEVVEQLGNMGI